jgi:hypothetical protein
MHIPGKQIDTFYQKVNLCSLYEYKSKYVVFFLLMPVYGS